jgi:hypothetical protein
MRDGEDSIRGSRQDRAGLHAPDPRGFTPRAPCGSRLSTWRVAWSFLLPAAGAEREPLRIEGRPGRESAQDAALVSRLDPGREGVAVPRGSPDAFLIRRRRRFHRATRDGFQRLGEVSARCVFDSEGLRFSSVALGDEDLQSFEGIHPAR